ncbi:MAG: SpoIID/LytB domain-containing protein, partial [Clostridia bacterium]|nr:SpoIID/LytB domain-containing protein [Clostridia bacterium]
MLTRTRATCFFCLVILFIIAFPTLSGSLSEILPSSSLRTESGSVEGTIRVWLSSIRTCLTYDITVSGSYSIGGAQLSNGSSVKIEFSGGNVFVTTQGNRRNMGASATLSRQSGGVKIAQSLAPGNIYPGNLRFFYYGGTAYVVCDLYIEEYLYGVLPYEMDNSFPLETLKAQAVAARTYAMRAKSPSGNYDVTDTTTHQVFRGVNYTRTRCIQAVDETWGVVLKQENAYAAAYYSASNGGQTEAAQNAWGGSPVSYLTVKDDPFDLANLRSVKKSSLIATVPAPGSSAYAMLQNALASKYGGSSAAYAIGRINDCTVHTPRFSAPSEVYSMLRVDITYNNGQTTIVDIPIFAIVKPTLGLSINSVQNELFTVERETNGFRI